MTSPSSPPPPAAPPPRRGPPKGLLIGLLTVLVGGAVAGAFVLGRRTGGKPDGTTATAPEASG